MFSLGQILEEARGKNILVTGDVMLDVYDFCYTDKSRMSPEAPDKRVYTASRSVRMLGGAGNVAANLTSLGASVSLLSVCGNDGNLMEVRRQCNEHGIAHYLKRDTSRPTTVKTRLYIDDQYVLRRDDEQTHKISPKLSAELKESFRQMLSDVDAVILSDYNKGVFSESYAREIITQCCTAGIPVVVDFKPANADYFHDATVVAPNLKEAREIIPGFDPYQKEQSMLMLDHVLGAKNLMVTLGAEGMLVYDGQQAAHIPGRKVEAVDPCGCGDTVRACLTLGLATGLNLMDSAEFANYAASLAVQKLGTATLSINELMKGKTDEENDSEEIHRNRTVVAQNIYA